MDPHTALAHYMFVNNVVLKDVDGAIPDCLGKRCHMDVAEYYDGFNWAKPMSTPRYIEDIRTLSFSPQFRDVKFAPDFDVYIYTVVFSSDYQYRYVISPNVVSVGSRRLIKPKRHCCTVQ